MIWPPQDYNLPKGRHDWTHLRLQNFQSVNGHNSTLLKNCSQLNLYGKKITKEYMLEKTFTTFHVSNVLL